MEVACIDRKATLTLIGLQAGLHMPHFNEGENPPAVFSAV